MTFEPDSRPLGIPAVPEDPLDVFKRRYPSTTFPTWAQPIEMPGSGSGPLAQPAWGLTRPTW